MKKIRWGILSTANIARERLIPAIGKSESGVVQAVASRNLEKARAFASELSIPRAFGSYEEMLADPEIDAIYCPLPTGMHYEWSMKCLEAGKPLLCEKPLTVKAEEAKEVFNAFEQADLLISEAYMYLYHPLNQKVKALVSEGRIGEVRSIHSIFHINADRSDIRFNRELGGGSILDLGCYCVGISRLVCGAEPLDAKSLAFIPESTEVDERRVGCMRFPDNVMATFSVALTSHFECMYEVFGSAGRIRVQKGGMIPWPGEAFEIELWTNEDYERIVIPATDHYELLVEDFNQALLTGKKCVVAHKESLRNLRALDWLRSEDSISK